MQPTAAKQYGKRGWSHRNVAPPASTILGQAAMQARLKESGPDPGDDVMCVYVWGYLI